VSPEIIEGCRNHAATSCLRYVPPDTGFRKVVQRRRRFYYTDPARSGTHAHFFGLLFLRRFSW
jgi:hypothetical protein